MATVDVPTRSPPLSPLLYRYIRFIAGATDTEAILAHRRLSRL
jgi:hypothetical protein